MNRATTCILILAVGCGAPEETFTEPLPTPPDLAIAAPGPVGASCSKDSECAGDGATCMLGWPGGYCTIYDCVRSPDSCPSGSICAPRADGATLCVADCKKYVDCREGYACPAYGACTPGCTANSCDADEECGKDHECAPAPCVVGGCPTGQVCLNSFCVGDVGPGPGAGPGPTCDQLPAPDCTTADCGTLEAFTPKTGPGYEDYPANGETATNQYRSYARRDVQALIKYASAFVACKAAGWTVGNSFPLGLGDMSEKNGAIPGTSIGMPGHPAGTHEDGFDVDVGYFQLTSPDNHLRPICKHTLGGQERSHCVSPPNNVDLWRSALFLGALFTSPRVRVIGVDGQAGKPLLDAMVTLCNAGWLPLTACQNQKVAYEVTNDGYGWYYNHHHHMHVSIDTPMPSPPLSPLQSSRFAPEFTVP